MFACFKVPPSLEISTTSVLDATKPSTTRNNVSKRSEGGDAGGEGDGREGRRRWWWEEATGWREGVGWPNGASRGEGEAQRGARKEERSTAWVEVFGERLFDVWEGRAPVGVLRRQIRVPALRREVAPTSPLPTEGRRLVPSLRRNHVEVDGGENRQSAVAARER